MLRENSRSENSSCWGAGPWPWPWPLLFLPREATGLGNVMPASRTYCGTPGSKLTPTIFSSSETVSMEYSRVSSLVIK